MTIDDIDIRKYISGSNFDIEQFFQDTVGDIFSETLQNKLNIITLKTLWLDLAKLKIFETFQQLPPSSQKNVALQTSEFIDIKNPLDRKKITRHEMFVNQDLADNIEYLLDKSHLSRENLWRIFRDKDLFSVEGVLKLSLEKFPIIYLSIL